MSTIIPPRRTPLLGSVVVPTPPAPGADYVTDWGVISYWTLDEASGTRNDSVTTHHLTDNNTVTTATAKVGTNAAQFTKANSEWLSTADTAALSPGNVDFWLACWIYLDSITGTFPNICSKGQNTAGSIEFSLEVDVSATKIRFLIGGSAYSVVSTASTVTTGQYYFVMAYHDSVGDLIGLSLNGSAFATAATANRTPPDTARGFFVGAQDAGPANYFDGRIDALVFGKNTPGGIAGSATAIRDRLYNSGSGREYPW